MIEGIIGNNFIDITGGTSSKPYINMGNPSAGMMRYNGGNTSIEVYDGSSWVTMTSNYASVGLNSAAQSVINWAMQKMAEEQELEQLTKDHPAVKIAYENMKKAAEQLKTTIILSKDEQKSTS